MTYTYKDKKTLRGLIEVALTEDYDKISDYLFTHANNYRDSEGDVWDSDGYIIHTTIAKPGENHWEHCGELEAYMQDDRLREIGIDNLIDGACKQLFNDEYTLSDFYEILESGDSTLIFAFINSQFCCEGEENGNSYGFDDLVLYVDFFPSESDNEIDELKNFFQILFTYECGSELEKHEKKYVELLKELEKYSELDEINTFHLDIDEYNEYERKKAEFEWTKGELFQLAKDIYDNYVYEIDRKMLLDAINDKYTIEEWKDEVKTVIAYQSGYYEN